MDQQKNNLFSPAGRSPAPESFTRRSFLPEGGDLHGMDSRHLFPGDQTLESALSRLAISQNLHHRHPPPPSPSPAVRNAYLNAPALDAYFNAPAVDTYLNPLAFNSGYQGLSNVGPQSYVGERYGLSGPHRDLMVGPRGPGMISGRSNGGMYGEPWYGSGAGAGDDSSSYGFLHRKQFQTRMGWKFSPGRSNQFDGITLLDMRGRIVALSKDQTGSKALQAKLDEGPTRDDIEWVLSEVLDSITELMKNQSASYFVQKLFGRCAEEQRTKMLVAATNNPYQFVDVGLNFNGARTVQKLLEHVTTEEQISLVVDALCPGTIPLANDPNGQHVIKYCVEKFPYQYHQDLFNEIVDKCYRVATDKSGCCVLQSCVVHSQGDAQERLITEIVSNALMLSQDPYGNYVVQHLLGLKMPRVAILLIRKLEGQFVALSCDKYGSNVVEKFITETEKDHFVMIIMEILSTPNADSMLVHPYGNFVIQKALTRARDCDRDVYRALCNLIDVSSQSMRSNLYGKKILAWFEKKRY